MVERAGLWRGASLPRRWLCGPGLLTLRPSPLEWGELTCLTGPWRARAGRKFSDLRVGVLGPLVPTSPVGMVCRTHGLLALCSEPAPGNLLCTRTSGWLAPQGLRPWPRDGASPIGREPAVEASPWLTALPRLSPSRCLSLGDVQISGLPHHRRQAGEQAGWGHTAHCEDRTCVLCSVSSA